MKLTILALAALVMTPAGAAAAPPPAARSDEIAAVGSVLSQYKAALERLDARGTEGLFSADSRIFESGGDEGSYAHYLEHHLGPELAEFRFFKFSDYKLEVQFEGPLALATETYRYSIVPKSGEAVERLGVATSVLKKNNGRWTIIRMHNSSRRSKTG